MRVGALTVCSTFVSWSATSIAFTLCNGVGFHLPVTLVLGPNHTSSESTSIASALSYLIVAPIAEQPKLASLSLRSPGTIEISFFAPSDTFNAVSKTRAWTPEDYSIEWAASVTDFPVECGNAPKRMIVNASSDPNPASLPLINVTLIDNGLFTLGATRALRLSALKLDNGVLKRMCTEPILFDVALPPAPPRNLSVSLGKITNEGKDATFLVNFHTSDNFGGQPFTACSYTIVFIELGINASDTEARRKTVPALNDTEQMELVTKMKPNTDYDAVVHAQCKVDPLAQGIDGVLHSVDSNHYSYSVKPHVEYAKKCGETGDFSSLISTRCISCPTEAEGAKCNEGLLIILEGHWMPDVSLARVIETREAMQTLFWKCKTLEACSSIPAKIEGYPGPIGAPTAVPRSVCGVGFKGHLCGNCDDNYGPLGDACPECPSPVVSLGMASGMAVWMFGNIAWQTYNAYEDARARGNGIAGALTGSVIKSLLDYFQLLAALAFIKVEPPQAVRELYSIAALGGGVGAKTMPIQCLFGWNVYTRTWFYIILAFLSMSLPALLGMLYLGLRYVQSRWRTWKNQCCAARIEGGDVPPQVVVVGAAEEGGTRRRRSSIIDTVTESIAQSEVSESDELIGPVELQLRQKFDEAVADPSGRATLAEFTALVESAAPNEDFILAEWNRRVNPADSTIGFSDFHVVMQKIKIRLLCVNIVTMTVVAVFFSYMKVSTELVAIFMPSDLIDNKYYLRSDLDVPAYTSEHYATMVFSGITLLLFTVGAPAFALIALIHYYRTSWLDQPEVFTMFGFLYAGYKEQYFWWESMVLLRKVASTVVALSPIGIELQALCATMLLVVLTIIQLLVCPFKNTWHNMLDCVSMGTIALKQLCALAYHLVTMNAVDTVASQTKLGLVTWVVNAILIASYIGLGILYFVTFTRFKVTEVNQERLTAVVAKQKAWRTGEAQEPTKFQRVKAYCFRRVLCQGEEEGEDDEVRRRRGRWCARCGDVGGVVMRLLRGRGGVSTGATAVAIGVLGTDAEQRSITTITATLGRFDRES